MYVPAKFVIDEDASWAAVRDAGAGMLVRTAEAGLTSVFVPVVVDEQHTTVRAHVARANPWWRSVDDGSDVLGLFVAASAYVSPSYYPSRLEDPGVVPTWNYVAVEVRGRLHVHDDATWLDDQVRELTTTFESGRPTPWRVDDAPAAYIERQLRAIVGITIDVLSIEGKAKLSQNRPQIDHDSVRDHLAQGSANERNVASRMFDA